MKPIRRLYHRAKGKARRALFRFASPEITLALRQLEQRAARAPSPAPFPTRTIIVAQRPPDAPILVLAPHPDDEVIGPGGALAQALERGDKVTVVYLTDGRGPGVGSLELAKTRRREAEALAAAFPFRQVFWDVPDNHLTDDAETMQALSRLIDEVRPRSIFAPSFFDHQFDHFAANILLAGALPDRHADLTVFGYEVWDNIPFPNFLLDISGHFETKAAMLRHYAVPNRVTDFVQFCRHRNAVHYLLYIDSVRRDPEGYAEAYYRLDADSYCALLADYRTILEEARSPLLSHLSGS